MKRKNVSSRSEKAEVASRLSPVHFRQETASTVEKKGKGRPKGANDTTQILHTRKELMKQAKMTGHSLKNQWF